ncbi:MAG: 50S ribosomal protein L18a [Thermoplasmata archaeon]|nr:MAG: 50S ribosomal protein L18a [Thermoplasmata archaeon]MCD6222475.1 50S ribosomal protein L18a [Thermoplasmata archaeon]
MKVYRVEGKFLMGKIWQPFSKEIIGNDENEARERLFSILGSRHRVKRRMIKIDSIREVNKEEIQDPVIKYMVER